MKLARVIVFSEGQPRKWEVTLGQILNLKESSLKYYKESPQTGDFINFLFIFRRSTLSTNRWQEIKIVILFQQGYRMPRPQHVDDKL